VVSTHSESIIALAWLDQGQAPIMSAITLPVRGCPADSNRVHLNGNAGGQGLTVSTNKWTAARNRHRPDVRVARMSIVSRRSSVYTLFKGTRSGSDGMDCGAIGLGQGGATLSSGAPPRYYGRRGVPHLCQARQGIRLTPEETVRHTLPSGTVVVRRPSEPLTEILRDMLRYSQT